MRKKERTPLPWHVMRCGPGDNARGFIGDGHSHVVTRCMGPNNGNADADAEFICRACNSYEEMVATLKDCEGLLSLICAVRGAIAKAEA